MICKPANNPTTPNEVWLLLDSFTFGGIETHVIELARGIADFNVPVKVVLLSQFSTPSAIVAKLEQASIAFHYLADLTRPKNLASQPNVTKAPSNHSIAQQCWQLRRAIKKHQPMAIHAHGYKASIISKLAVKTVPGLTQQITTYHAGEVPSGKVRLYDALDRYSSPLSKHSLCVSPQIQARLPVKSHCLNNFVGMQSAIKSQGKQLAFVGRLSHEKGPDSFLDLAMLHPEHSFYVYGDGPMQEELAQRALHNVHLLGFSNDMHQCWQNIGLLIITSRFEGLPMTALEAMSRGIPVLALNVGALEKLIDQASNGWVVDDITALSQCLQQWFEMTTPEKEHMANNAINTIEQHYSTQAVVPKILSLYQS
ncbi:putative glycosyltransferase [Vibrio halioticoli NBRC 102217]|uniref:Putative glycosyltransferase n=1 Tax=Vibrio halioticoli NBRC 102217 TaxID=1219072 RepID=V5FCU6_9VIBR|nr:glycosyltransferase family 4 protein [Vibrio halioticoli]GAD89348.1 putative glycosyltransferase [Vibrio halioticoli NBRC 102217]